VDLGMELTVLTGLTARDNESWCTAIF